MSVRKKTKAKTKKFKALKGERIPHNLKFLYDAGAKRKKIAIVFRGTVEGVDVKNKPEWCALSGQCKLYLRMNDGTVVNIVLPFYQHEQSR